MLKYLRGKRYGGNVKKGMSGKLGFIVEIMEEDALFVQVRE